MKTSKVSKAVRNLVLAAVCAVTMFVAGCSTTKESVKPIPVPTVDTKTEIIGLWECIDSMNTTIAFKADFKPDGIMIYTDGKTNKVTEFKYTVIDNNTLVLVIKEKDAVKVTLGLKCKINGSIMYWSHSGQREHGERYTIVFTLHKLKNSVAKKESK